MFCAAVHLEFHKNVLNCSFISHRYLVECFYCSVLCLINNVGFFFFLNSSAVIITLLKRWATEENWRSSTDDSSSLVSSSSSEPR